MNQRQANADQWARRLQDQRRYNHYRFQQEYIQRLREQQLRAQNWRNYNYSNDPYFYTAPSYRYSRGGRYYEVNQYAADLLRQAVNYGYEEGFRAGQADREDGWRSGGYQDTYAYQDGNFGYTGYYVNREEYNYYFREGFRRGYEDGYNSRNQYGTYSGGRYSILGAVLGSILNLQNLFN
jgi:hypothetical protein